MSNPEPTRNEQSQAGKGDSPRPVKGDAFRAGWERIFGPRQDREERKLRRIDSIRRAAEKFVDGEQA